MFKVFIFLSVRASAVWTVMCSLARWDNFARSLAFTKASEQVQCGRCLTSCVGNSSSDDFHNGRTNDLFWATFYKYIWWSNFNLDFYSQKNRCSRQLSISWDEVHQAVLGDEKKGWTLNECAKECNQKRLNCKSFLYSTANKPSCYISKYSR